MFELIPLGSWFLVLEKDYDDNHENREKQENSML